MKLLTAIISCHAHRHKRDAVRDTWLKRLPGEHFFYTGIGDTVLEPDVLQFPFEDVRGAAHRTHAAFKYALERYAFDWLFRVDDDTFVVPERIPTLFWEPNAEMIGGDVMAKWNWGTGGAGCCLPGGLFSSWWMRASLRLAPVARTEMTAGLAGGRGKRARSITGRPGCGISPICARSRAMTW